MEGNVKVEGSHFADVDVEVEVVRAARVRSVAPKRPGDLGGVENMMCSECVSLVIGKRVGETYKERVARSPYFL